MQTDEILVAMDDSEASRRLLAAVAARARQLDTVRVVLCHLLPPLPPELLESRGSENSEEERRIEHDQETAQAQLIAKETAAGEKLLAESKKALEGHGVGAERIQTKVTEPVDSHDKLVDALVAQAKKLGCGTIAVGRKSFPVLREILHAHLGEKLERRADGLKIWIVD